MIKRTLDILLSIFGLILLIPIAPFVAVLIKLDSKGPILYPCERIGRNRKEFLMYKFRTMVETRQKVGHSVSPQGDVRVTRIGRILRRSKLNELPQLINILKGEMSFVGPRPEAPDLAELYPTDANIVFSVKPGLVGPSQAKFRNEEEMYPEGADPQQFYIEHILPEKLEIDLEYIRQPTLRNYLYYILIAVRETLFGLLNQKHFFENSAQLWLFAIDLVFIVASYYYAVEIRFGGALTDELVDLLLKVFPFLLVVRVLCFIGFGLYGVLIRYLNLYNYLNVMKAVTVSSLLTAVAVYLFGFSGFPRTILVIDWFILNFMMIAIRIPGKLMRTAFIGKADTSKPGVFIYGACKKGIEACDKIKQHKTVLGFLDDDNQHKNKKIREYPVLGNKFDIEPLSKIYPAHEVVIATPDLDKNTLNKIYKFCHQANLECSVYTDIEENVRDKDNEEYVIGEKIKGWAGVVEEDFNRAHVNNTFEKRSVMLIGASPKLAGNLAGYLSGANLSHLHVAEHYEHFLNDTMQSVRESVDGMRAPVSYSYDPVPTLNDLAHKGGVPEVIVYMGTRKYPYLLNVKPIEVVENNIIKPLELYEKFAKNNGNLFAFGSTVNASRPEHIIQKTLSLAETYLANAAAADVGKVCIFRLPSLVDNTGSIVETIRGQIRDRRSVTIAHPEEERYFSTVSEAAKFILHAIAMSNGKKDSHQIFQFKVTKKVRITELIDKISHNYGRNGSEASEIKAINVENAQIWREKIKNSDNGYARTEYGNILILKANGQPRQEDIDVADNIRIYKKLVREGDEKKLYDRVVEDYAKYCELQKR